MTPVCEVRNALRVPELANMHEWGRIRYETGSQGALQTHGTCVHIIVLDAGRGILASWKAMPPQKHTARD